MDTEALIEPVVSDDVAPDDATPEEPQTLSAEERLQGLTDELAKTKTKLEQVEKGFNSANRTIKQKDDSLKEQTAIRQEIDDMKTLLKLVGGAVAQSQGANTGVEDFDGMPKEQRKDLLSAFGELEATQKLERQKAQENARISEYTQTADTLWKRAESLGLTNEDENYWNLRNALRNTGDLEYAEHLVSKLEKSKASADSQKATTEDPDKRAKEILKEKGVLTSDVSTPSGVGHTDDAAFIEGIGSGRLPLNKANMERARKLGL